MDCTASFSASSRIVDRGCVVALLNAGADVNAMTEDFNYYTPLRNALLNARSYSAALQLVQAGADIYAKDNPLNGRR